MPDKTSTRTFDFGIDTVTLSLDGAGQVTGVECTCALWNGLYKYRPEDCAHIKKAKFSYANPDATPAAVNAIKAEAEILNAIAKL